MRIHKDNIKTFIVIFIICAICLLLVIFLNKKTNYEKLTYVNEYSEFFSISNYINKYINYVSNKNTEATFSLLDKNYLEDKLINKENIFNIIKQYEKGVSVNITDIKYVNIKNNIIYYVHGNLIKNNYDEIIKLNDSFDVIFLFDKENNTYSIYPLDNDNEDKINKIKEVKIEKNSYNIFENKNKIVKERICSFYLSNYLNLLDNDLKEAYKITSDKMKIRYNNYESFKEYINNNINNISSTADKCKLDEYKKERVYSVIDKNGNKYVFTEKNILNYEIDIYINN